MTNFSAEDRERIRSELLESGRELFARFGFDRTRVSDVTESAGIGTSTFYQFFDSKEMLYVEVLCAERDSLEAQIEEAVAEADTPKDEVRALLRTMFRGVRSNRLISRLIVEGELRQLQDQLSESERRFLAVHAREGELAPVERWARMDEFAYDDPERIRGMFLSLAFVTRSRETLTTADDVVPYEEVEDGLIETIVNGLFSE